MRSLSDSELKAIAQLSQIPPEEREIQQSQQRAIVVLGKPLPVIHQVLFS